MYSLWEQNRELTDVQSLDAYRKARDAWAAMATRAKMVYAADISYGSTAFRRGNWADRLTAIDADLDTFNKQLSARIPPQRSMWPNLMEEATQRALAPTPRPTLTVHHTAPTSFHPGSDLWLTIATPRPLGGDAILWYRHVNHGERWLSMPMHQTDTAHTAAIPAAYTDSPYPLQYYFELHAADAATLHPAFNPTLSNQPYYSIHLRT